MRITKTTLLLYNLIVTSILITIGFATQTYKELAPTLLLIPIGVYFSISFLAPFNIFNTWEKNKKFLNLVKVLKFYSFTIVTFMILASLAYSGNSLEGSLTIIFLPLLAWFFLDIVSHKNKLKNQLKKIISIPKPRIKSPLTRSKSAKNNALVTEPVAILEELEKTNPPINPFSKISEILNSTDDLDPNVQDHKKRQFLKIIGGGGVSLFLTLFVFKQNASAAFFGSGGGPGVVALKDSAGTKIDPAEKQPTDGYNISEIDDVALPSYYGFVHKNGNWYIAKEESSGAYRYTKGNSGFSANWTIRAALTYDYFSNVFS